MEAAHERFCVLVDKKQELQTLIIKQTGAVKRPVLVISLMKPEHLSKYPDRFIRRAKVEENPIDPQQPDLHDEVHRNIFPGFLLVDVRLEFNGQEFATAVKCKDLEAEAAIETLMPSGPNLGGWPWSELQKQFITTIVIDRPHLLAASRHPDGLASLKSEISLRYESYPSNFTREQGFGDNDDNAIVAFILKGRQQYQLSWSINE